MNLIKVLDTGYMSMAVILECCLKLAGKKLTYSLAVGRVIIYVLLCIPGNGRPDPHAPVLRFGMSIGV